MPTQRAGRETGSFFQSDVQAEQVSTLPPARHNWPYCPDLEWDDEHEQTQPDLARLDVPHAVDAQGFAMLADSGEHPDHKRRALGPRDDRSRWVGTVSADTIRANVAFDGRYRYRVFVLGTLIASGESLEAAIAYGHLALHCMLAPPRLKLEREPHLVGVHFGVLDAVDQQEPRA